MYQVYKFINVSININIADQYIHYWINYLLAVIILSLEKWYESGKNAREETFFFLRLLWQSKVGVTIINQLFVQKRIYLNKY